MKHQNVEYEMKKVLLVLFAAILAVNTAWAERVSQEDAAIVANNFMNVAPANSGAKKMAPAKHMVLKANAATAEPQYYIYENANGEGWVMVAANDVVRPILAYSETGSFRTDNMPRNVKGWLQGYDKQIKYVAAHRSEASETVKAEWTKLRAGKRQVAATVVVAPLIQTGWDQDSPFWNLCPSKSGSRCYTGCVATAMAQVMNYHEWPKQGTGSHSITYNRKTYTANFGETTYDWDNMLDVYTSGQYTTTQSNAVATLMYHCGIAVDMEYGTADEGGSGAYSISYNGYWDTQNTMCAETALTRFFGYDASSIKGYCRDGSAEDDMRSWTKSEWQTMLKAELDAARPIMYAGVGCDDPNDNNTCYGHSFICDGYDSNDYFHFNFGWSNWCDGYYDVDALETHDPGSGGGNGEYNLQQDVIVGIQPPVISEDSVVVVWIAGNTTFETTVSRYGKYVLPSATPAACDNKEFVGWCKTANYSSATTAPAYVKNGDDLTQDTCYAVFASVTQGSANIDDVLTRATTGVTGNDYESWSDVTVTSSAVYAGQSAGRYSSIQLRSKNNNSGIVTTASGGTVQKITVDWNENTVEGRKLDIYGKNSAYTSAAELYENSNRGTYLGSIVYGTSTQLVVEGDYAYVGVRSNNSALYMNSLTITWAGTGAVYADFTTVCGGSQDVENVNANAAAHKQLLNGQIVIIRGDAVYTVTGARIK